MYTECNSAEIMQLSAADLGSLNYSEVVHATVASAHFCS